MKVTIKGPAVAPAGTYTATFEGLEEKTSKDGNPYWRWAFQILTPEGAKDVSGGSSTNTGPRAKSFKWFGGLLGRAPVMDAEVDISELVGRPCLVVIEENDNGFADVVDVLPAPRLSAATVQSLADEADLDGLPF